MKFVIAGWLWAAGAFAAPPAAMGPFHAKDLNGKEYKSEDFSGDKALVLVSYQVACGVLRRQAPEIERIAAEYGKKSVRFFFVNGSLQDDPASISKESKSYKLKVPILLDPDQAILRDAGFTVTAEVLVLDAKTHERIYQGPVNDRVSVEGIKAKANPYLRDALDDFIAGRPVKEAKRRPFGCTISYAKQKDSP